jgi:hypothetical protein
VVSMHAWTHSIGSVHRGRRVGFQFAEDGADAGCRSTTSVLYHARTARALGGRLQHGVCGEGKAESGGCTEVLEPYYSLPFYQRILVFGCMCTPFHGGPSRGGCCLLGAVSR